MNQRIKVTLSLAFALLLHAANGWAASASSTYREVLVDTKVSGSSKTVLTTPVTLATPGWVYLQSDGRIFPDGAGMASIAIWVNGQKVSNDSVQDWRGSTNPQQRSYNVVGVKYLPAGTHTVSLLASTAGAGVYFGSRSNLSVMTDAATTVTNAGLTTDTAQLNFNTVGVLEGSPLPAAARSQILSSTVASAGGPIVAFASGRSYVYGGYGDPMWGIFLNGAEPNIANMTWTINDMYTGAELQAPMFTQALFDLPAGNHAVSLQASESPYDNGLVNNVKYKIGANTRLVTLSGGMQVVGSALNPNASYYTPNRRYAYVCIGSSIGTAGCPAAGTETVLGEGIIDIPSGHNGVVLISAKSRVQGDQSDIGGTVELYLKVDGVVVGSWGVQQLAAPDSVSTRTISASYLASGANALSPGAHTIEVIGRASGSFKHLSMNADMPALWFD